MTSNDLTLAYTAGLFDGEGSVVIGVGKTRAGSPLHWLQVQITSTDRSVIEWLREEFGGHISSNSRSKLANGHRPCWAWRVMSNQAKNFLELLLPHLKVKKRQAELAIAFQNSRGRRYGSLPLPESELAERERFRFELRRLNSS